MTKFSERGGSGYGLFVDEDGSLSVWLGGPRGRVAKISSEPPLRPWIPAIPGMNERAQGVSTAWTFVAASFDAASGRVVLYQKPRSRFAFDETRAVVERKTDVRSISSNAEPLLIAAYNTTPGEVGGHFNGKIDNPRIYARALSRAEIEAIDDGEGPSDALAPWDFSVDIESDVITDRSRSALHGRTVNLPMRAVTGHNWDSTITDYRGARGQYGAIFFHDDDLDDAGWEAGCAWQVPASQKSGLYAARLRTAAAEDYIPFVVRPRKGTASARIALLIPTFSYLAYAGTGTSAFRPLSLYSRHSDGSGVCYSSRLRPITNMRPKIDTRNPWQFMVDTHLIDWLDAKGFEVDLLTDEDLHEEGASALSSYKVVLTGTHPEYYSVEMLDGVTEYLDGGGRVMYMGGNGFYWVTPMDATGRYIEVRRRDGTEHWQGAPGEHHHSLTGEPGGLWRFRGRAPQQYFGVGFTAQGFDRNSPFRRQPGSFDPRGRVHLRGHWEGRAHRQSPVAGARLRRGRLRARPRGLRAGDTGPHVDPRLLVRSLGRLSARRRADQHRKQREHGRYGEPARAGGHGVSRAPARRRGLCHELDRVVRRPVVQQLFEQRLAHHRERPEAIRLRRSGSHTRLPDGGRVTVL